KSPFSGPPARCADRQGARAAPTLDLLMGKRKRRNSLPAPPSPPVTPGLVSPLRTVRAGVPRPEYATTGEPSSRASRAIRTPEEIEAMRVAGRVAAEALIEVGNHIRPGITTDELDRIGHEA